MKLKNRKTGVIGDLVAYDAEKGIFAVKAQGGDRCYYYSLAALHEVWEDYEEPKEYWAIDIYSKGAEDFKNSNDDVDKFNKEIGNYFSSREEAEKALEKLKAWKRLKDKGFRVVDYGDENIRYEIKDRYDGCLSDLETVLFGGEE